MAKQRTPALQQVKALTFDVFGTVVDWRGSITREGRTLGKELGVRADWAAFADALPPRYPAPKAPRAPAPWLGCEPHEGMMVAAHKNDLRAAQSAGLRAAFVQRPLEF